MRNCYLSRNYKEINSAGNKAKTDIEQILSACAFTNVGLKQTRQKNTVVAFLLTLAGILRLPFSIRKGDRIVVQYPLKKYFSFVCRIAHAKGAQIITIIHDLGSFRRKKLTPEHEIKRLAHADYIIDHNPHMQQWLVTQGCRLPIGILGIFDYLSTSRPTPRPTMPSFPYAIAYAGALNPRKNRFLYQLEPCLHSLSFHLYGNGFEIDKVQHPERFTYHGFVDSDQLIATVQGDFGLVWDGDSITTCTGNFGEYLRYNNPHKASLYLRCHLPLIVWDESGLAPFVRDHHIGICLHSLEDLEATLSRITSDEYATLHAHVVQLSQALASGEMIQKALKTLPLPHNE